MCYEFDVFTPGVTTLRVYSIRRLCIEVGLGLRLGWGIEDCSICKSPGKKKAHEGTVMQGENRTV